MLPQKLLYCTVSHVGSEALLMLTAGLYMCDKQESYAAHYLFTTTHNVFYIT